MCMELTDIVALLVHALPEDFSSLLELVGHYNE